MQMSNRIVRRWIAPLPEPDLHQDNPWQWLRGQRSSPGQNEQPAADGHENVWTWSRLYSMTKILIDSNVCLSVWECIWTSVIPLKTFLRNIHCVLVIGLQQSYVSEQVQGFRHFTVCTDTIKCFEHNEFNASDSNIKKGSLQITRQVLIFCTQINYNTTAPHNYYYKFSS